MKRLWKAGLIILLAAAFLTGCAGAGKNEESGQETEAEPEQVLYPVMIGGSEVRVGETTVQTLLDEGLSLTVSEMDEDMQITEYEIDPDMELEANSYYTGGSIWISDSVFAHVSLATDEDAARMGDAVIARLEFYLQGAETDELEKISLDGVPVTEISKEKADGMFPDFTGDDYMLLQYGPDYEYTMSFDAGDRMLVQFSVAKVYDVDWSGTE